MDYEEIDYSNKESVIKAIMAREIVREKSYEKISLDLQRDFDVVEAFLLHKRFFDRNINFVDTVINNLDKFNDEQKEFIFDQLIFRLDAYSEDYAKKIVGSFSNDFLISHYNDYLLPFCSDDVLIALYINNSANKIKEEVYKRIEKSGEILLAILNNTVNVDLIIDLYNKYSTDRPKRNMINRYVVRNINNKFFTIDEVIKLVNVNWEYLTYINDKDYAFEILKKEPKFFTFLIDYPMFEDYANMIAKMSPTEIKDIIMQMDTMAAKKLLAIFPEFNQYIFIDVQHRLSEYKNNFSDVDELKDYIKFFPFASVRGDVGGGSSTAIGDDFIYSFNCDVKIDVSFLLDNCEELNNMDYNFIPFILKSDGDNEKRKEEKKQIILKTLRKIYGEEMFLKLLPSINMIFDRYCDEMLISTRPDIKEKYSYSFKLLYNKEIINSNPPELIQSFLQDFLAADHMSLESQQVACAKSAADKFYQIIGNTYGERAVAILKSRPGLNVLTMSSLEVFRPEILNNFCDGFVHDLISYDISGFNTFLLIVKNPEDLELYKKYYTFMAGIYGESVITMQKTFLSYFYVKDLLIDALSKGLDEEEMRKFATVLCGEFNRCNIKSVDELDQYDARANEDLLYHIENDKNNNLRPSEHLKRYKIYLFNNLFSLNEADYYRYSTYPLYSKCEEIYMGLSQEELDIVMCMDKIKTIESIEELKEYAKGIVDQNISRNPVMVVGLMEKLRLNVVKYINKVNNYATSDKLQELIEKGKLTVVNEDGVDIYIYDDFDSLGINMPGHSTDFSYDKLMTLEGSMTCSTISMHQSPRVIDKSYFLFIPNSVEIVASYGADAGIAGESRAVYSMGKSASDISFGGKAGEIAFFRRFRDHRLVNNNNYGGCISPNVIRGINDSNIENAKKFNAVIFCSTAEYEMYLSKKESRGSGTGARD